MPARSNYKKAIAALRKRLAYVSSLVNEDPECPHCTYFDSNEWDGCAPSMYREGYVRPCPLHREPAFPNIKARQGHAESVLVEQLETKQMVAVDWAALEDQLCG